MPIRKNVASGVSGSHFVTMRESMPEIKSNAEDDEKPTERSWALGPLFEPISSPHLK